MTNAIIFIGCIFLVLIAEFSPPPKRSWNTKIRKPKRSYKSSDYTIDSTSFHVVDSGDCDASFHDDIKKMIQSEKPLDIEKLEKLIDKVVDSGDDDDDDDSMEQTVNRFDKCFFERGD